MGEPLAAALLSGAVLAVLWAAGPRASPAREMATARGLLFGALALVRPEYLGVALLVSLVVLVREVGSIGGGSLAQAALLLVGVAVVVAPGPCAMRSRSTGSCRSRPVAGRFCSPGPTCRRTAIRKRSEPRWSSGIPSCSARTAARKPAAGADPGAAGRSSAIPGWKPTRRSRRWAGTALGRRQRRAARIRRLRGDEDRADLVARAARRDARAGLGAAALGAPRLRPARPGRARAAAALGGAAARDDLRSRSPRSAPCWSPRRGGCW